MQLSNTQPQSSPVGIVSFTTTSPSRSSNFSTISCGVITILHWRYSSFNFARILYRNPIIAGSILPSVFRRDLLTVNWRTNVDDMTNLSVEYNAFDGHRIGSPLSLVMGLYNVFPVCLVSWLAGREGEHTPKKRIQRGKVEKRNKRNKRKTTECMIYVIMLHTL